MVRLEYVIFWILILSVIGIALWLAFGSPEFNSSLIAIAIFVASSVIFLWKALFAIDKRNAVGLIKVDKKTALGFERVRSDFRGVNNKLSNIERDVNEIKNILKNK